MIGDPVLPTNQPYAVQEFALKHGLHEKAARVILAANGPSPVRCDSAAVAFIQAKAARIVRSK